MKKKISFFIIIIFISCNRSSLNDQAGEKKPQTAGLKIETPEESNKRKGIPEDVSDFMINISIEKMYSIELHKHAVANLPANNLKAIAENALDTDIRMMDELTQLAGQENITLPIVMDQTHQQAFEKLTAIKDHADFENEYVRLFLKSIETTENLFESGSEAISNLFIKAYIDKKLPVIKGQKAIIGRMLSKENSDSV